MSGMKVRQVSALVPIQRAGRHGVVRIPVVTSPNGKGSIDETHEMALGPIGRNGSYQANEATRNADVILALGCSFDDRTTSAWLEGYTLAIPPTALMTFPPSRRAIWAARQPIM